jgi:menaquinone-specific isochorismate synthase
VGAQHPDAGRPAPDQLTVRTVAIRDPGDLLAALPAPATVAWLHDGDGMAGWGEAARLTLPAGTDRFTSGEKWLRELCDSARVTDEVGAPGTGLVALGSFTFDPASDGSVLVIPRVLLARRDGRSWLTTIGEGTGGEAEALSPALRAALSAGAPPAPSQAPAHTRNGSAGGLRWSDGSLSAPEWEQAVTAAVRRIRAGELAKVVLARDLHAVAPAPIDVPALLARLAARSAGSYTFVVAGLAGSSPELLVRREGSSVSSLVLAGTAPRGGSPAEDEELSAALLSSAKEAEEHRYAAESVAEVLAPLCERLEVAAGPALLRLADVQHLATPMRGTLARDASALTLAALLHPSAAVCGTPTETAMEVIRELEGMDRGRYAGPVGWVDDRGNGEWCIALRCGEISGAQARLIAGCGIVADSRPRAELAETVAKFRPMRQALES